MIAITVLRITLIQGQLKQRSVKNTVFLVAINVTGWSVQKLGRPQINQRYDIAWGNRIDYINFF